MNRCSYSLSLFFVVASIGCGNTSIDSPQPEAAESAAPVQPTDPGRRPELAADQLALIRAEEGERAQRALAEVESRFAERSPGLTFRVHRLNTTSLGDTHVLIQQVYRGVPVERRDLLAVVLLDESIRIFGAPDRFEGLSLPAPAALAKAEGWAKERKLSLAKGGERWLVPVFERRQRPGTTGENATDFETVVARFDSGTLVKVDAGPGYLGPRELFLRDRDGAVIERAFPQAANIATLQGLYEQSSKYIETYRDSRGSYWLRDIWGDKVRAGTYQYRGTDNVWGDSNAYYGGGVQTANGETAAADALISLWANAMTYQHIYQNISFKPVTAWVHTGAKGAAGYIDGSGYWHIELGYDDPAAIAKKPMTDIETVGHEVGHLTLTETTGVTSWGVLGEHGGLVEGCSDIFGMNASFYFSDALHPRLVGQFGQTTPVWPTTLAIQSDWIFGNRSGSVALRSFIDPVHPMWSPNLANEPSHEAGGPLRRMYYFLSVGILPLGTPPSSPAWNVPQRDSFYVPAGMTGLGVDTAHEIWWQSIYGLNFSNVTDYASYRTAMLNAASVLYGKPHTPQYKAVEDAWAAVNVGAPADRVAPVVNVSVQQQSRTVAEITVDVAPDASGFSSSTVQVFSAFKNVGWVPQSCTGHCVYTIDPSKYGSSNSHRVRVEVTDNAGNTTVKELYFSLDASGPSITLTPKTTNDPDDPYQVWDVYIQDSMGLNWANVTVDGFPIRSASWPNAYVQSYTFSDVTVDKTSAPDGRFMVVFTAEDHFGNQRSQTVTLIKDTTPPEKCELVVGPASSDMSEVNKIMSGTDNGKGIGSLELFELGVGLIASDYAATPPGVANGLSHVAFYSPGKHTFYGICADQNGNWKYSPTVAYTVNAPCNQTQVSGGYMVDQTVIELGKTSGTAKLTYVTFDVHDRIKVIYEGNVVLDTGCVATGSGIGWANTFTYSGSSTKVTVRVEPSCDPATAATTTKWNYTVSCP